MAYTGRLFCIELCCIALHRCYLFFYKSKPRPSTSKRMSCFIVRLTLLWWSGTELAISLKYACTFKGGRGNKLGLLRDFTYYAHFYRLSFKGLFSVFWNLYLICPKKVTLLGTLEKINIPIWTCIHISYLYAMVNIASSILAQNCKDRESKLVHCWHYSTWRATFVVLLENLKWFGNSQVIWSCHSFRKYSAIHWCWAQLNSLGSYIRLLVSFDGGKSLGRDENDMKQDK